MEDLENLIKLIVEEENHFKENSIVYDVRDGASFLVLGPKYWAETEWCYELLGTNGEFTSRTESLLTSGLTEEQRKELLIKSYLEGLDEVEMLLANKKPNFKKDQTVFDLLTGEKFLVLGSKLKEDKYSYLLERTNGETTFCMEGRLSPTMTKFVY